MLKLLALVLMLASLPVFAAEDCQDHCVSQLLRFEVASNVFDQGAPNQILPGLKKLSETYEFQSYLMKPQKLSAIGFPQNLDVCEREKAEGDVNFKNINCQAPGLCGDEKLHPAVREKICFKLPCPILEGELNKGKCNGVEDIFPVGIAFPGTMNITKLNMTPTLVDYKNNVAKLCIRIDQLELTLNTSLTLDAKGTNLPDKAVGIGNINPVLDKPRELCMTADMNIGSKTPVSNIQIIATESGPLISDQVIRDAAKKIQLSGLSGYRPEDLASVQNELLPVLLQPMRSSVEEAVKKSLAQEFEKELKTFIPDATPQHSMVDSRAMMSELGIHNQSIMKHLANAECSVLTGARKSIPSNHPCKREIQPHYFSGTTPTWALDDLEKAMKDKLITSEMAKQRLLAMKEDISNLKTNSSFFEKNNMVDPEVKKDIQKNLAIVDRLVDQISNAQLKSRLGNMFEIHNKIVAGDANAILLSLPETCTPKPSPHVGKRIPNCPIQVYADLNEFNELLNKMWETGRICMQGEGKFTPKMNEYNFPMSTPDGVPIASSGCHLDLDGMSCYMKRGPQLAYDPKIKKYRAKIQLEKCFRGPVAFGLGKIGGDLNIDMAFDPKACDNGDFCIQNPEATFEVVKGTEKFALRPTSPLSETVNYEMQKAISNALAKTIRLPLASGVGPMAAIPVQAEGRVDTGPGYFGACFEMKSGAKPE